MIGKLFFFTESSPTSEQQQASYNKQLVILGSEHHLLTFPRHLLLHAKRTHKQTQQLYGTLFRRCSS